MIRSLFQRAWASVGGVLGGSLYARAMRSSAMTVIQFGGENALRLASNLILTRLLFPEAFGLMSLVTVIMTGLLMFTDLGTRSAVLQSPRGREPIFLNTAWTLQVVRCAILWLLTCALALPMAAFYEEPQLAQLLPASGLGLLIVGFGSTRVFEVNRDLQLGRLTSIVLGTQLLGAVTMVVLAWTTHSVWALVIGGLVATVAKTILTHTALPGTPNRFRLEPAASRALFSFGRWIFLSSMAGFIVRQGDRAILGKFISVADLGIYNIAYFLATVPVLMGAALVSKVIFPLYTLKNPAESAANRHKLSRARILVSGALLFGIAILALAGDWLIRILYDSRYYGGGPILILLALATIPELLLKSYGELFLAAGHSGRFAFYMITRAIVQSTFLILLIMNFGLVAVPLALFASTLTIYPLVVWMIRPYRAWDPVHDMLVITAGVGIGGLAFWLHADLLAPVLAPVLAAF